LIIVDTSVLIPFFRGADTTPVARMVELEQKLIPFGIPAICCQERLQGAKDLQEWKLLTGYLETQELVSGRDPWQSHWAAARIYFDCRRKGITISSSIDCLIAQLVLESDGVLLHDDADFELIKRVRPLQTVEI
jgi:predicted nucleic acid-binding protein